MAQAFSPEEVEEVVSLYPGLKVLSPGVLAGEFLLNHEFSSIPLQDKFQIQLTASNPNSNRTPALMETGGRTEEIARKYKLGDVRDLHKNLADGTACVCVRQEEMARFPAGASLLTYIENLVVPYLYGLSYFDKFRKWPWGEYSHGGLGMLEFYADDADTQSEEQYKEAIRSLLAYPEASRFRKQLRKPSAKRECICGSGKAFGKCHPRAWRGLDRMVMAMRRLGLNPEAG